MTDDLVFRPDDAMRAIESGTERFSERYRRGTLVLDNLKALVLDEADEMLRMGFIEDVEWILEQTPADRQFSA